ncbi:bifunctional folylpolyglutamate synthase/dihydrofolate synthase [Clostridium tertium]|jgi:dihydrofolate synthase / folylpolyglutamate synthase|uniref:bifunctional folylpolyglutamate synthase/dihydrofolate synthase n=1 Tax=Clostridium TaxID=1485 RepID=UPI00019AFD06|nr:MULTISPECIES: folylpolyglutamate synthase/dihydrofolate synthase family protein [Clostridium]EEH97559.1 FolC protein [Clostridium sp. 7_2_43FAA]MBS5306342.1 bifunctional folylpolyglutamate synthase/dihydrofolate synthase [Clostridium sp.]MDB1923951.1 bifunctional folylpolyglutamate synthase/dihydrofolate synthase [Clostridium tertium]MDB1927082.1 bifunctional folylpolyglutamate synthase/dihydrofolate synthase [Clostridium tertium]MDB1930794.1 bifunctional folylpolyglutamate synthase/dihydro
MKDLKTIKYLEELRVLGSNYGLERTERLLELLGNPHKKLKLIHIAGTNGKGSTSSILGKVLIEHGYKVGFFNSPHLEEIEETIRVNDENIPEEDLVYLLEEIKPYVNKVVEEGYKHPTEFEVLTCIMFLYLYRQKVDFGVIEVGLGGRLDSTNVIKPILSIITSISLDHTNILGNTIQEITNEKAGIIKDAIPVITCNQKDEALYIIKNKALLTKSKLTIVDSNDFVFLEIVNDDIPYQRVSVNFNNNKYTLDLALLGKHQIINLSLAIKALEELEKLNYIKVNINKLYKGVKNVKWKGRLEVLKKDPFIVIDGAHNIAGIEFLKSNIEEYFKYKNLYLILGILADKNVEEMVKIIAPVATEVYTVTANSIRAASANELKEVVLEYNNNCIAFDDYDKAIKLSLSKANKDDLIVAAGSLYMIGEIRKQINNI